MMADVNPSFEQWARDTFARRDEVLTRSQADAQMSVLTQRYREDARALNDRVAALEEWKSNLIGRGIGIAIIGTIFVAVCASVITRIIFGGG